MGSRRLLGETKIFFLPQKKVAVTNEKENSRLSLMIKLNGEQLLILPDIKSLKV